MCVSRICNPDSAAESSGGSITCTPEEARVEAESQLKQEENEFLKSISNIIEVKVGNWIGVNLSNIKHCFPANDLIFLDSFTDESDLR